ncbi:MAG TPA: RIP metalloprotease RseP [Alphaproteobacteria bacterium]
MPENLNDVITWLGGNTTMYLLPFLAVISILVFVHEWGHYIVARLCGVRVETFSIGFGKKLWSRRDKHGTEWQVALFPLGGYVKMFGDTDPASSSFTESVKEGETIRQMTPAEREEAFFSKSVGQRAAIVFAGPAINFIFAIIVMIGLFMSVGQPVTPPVAAAVAAEGAAAAAGIQPLDRVVSINGEPTRRFSDIQRSVAVSLDTPLTLEVERNGEIIKIENVLPKIDNVTDRFGFSHSRGLLGIISAGSAFSIDAIEAVNGESGDIKALLKSHMGSQARLTMKGAEGFPSQDLIVRLQPDLNGDLIAGGADVDSVMLAPAVETENTRYGLIGATQEALRETWFVTVGTLEALGQMIAGTRSAQELGGIIRIGAVTGDAAAAGFASLLMLGALLSINLGLINLFPIPMLDGGHLVFYAIEAIKGRPIPEKVQDAALRFGFYILIGLMLFANINDILQLAR